MHADVPRRSARPVRLAIFRGRVHLQPRRDRDPERHGRLAVARGVARRAGSRRGQPRRLGGFLATLFRSTALAVGLGLFYALVLEGLVFALPLPNESFQDARRFFLGQNSGFLADSFAGSSLQQPFMPLGLDVVAAQAALVHCLYLAAFVLIAALAFRQRDVAKRPSVF
jgi:hypothetical protein